MNLIFAVIFFGIVWAMLNLLASAVKKDRKSGREYNDKLEEFVFIEYNKGIYPLRREELDHWNQLDRTERRDWIATAEKNVGKGKLKKEDIGGGRFMYIATEKAKEINFWKDKYYEEKHCKENNNERPTKPIQTKAE